MENTKALKKPKKSTTKLPKKIAPPKASEHMIQCAFIKIVKIYQLKMPELELLFAVPNAAKRSYGLAAMMKAEGMISGVPDIMFPVSRGHFKGLAFEFKKDATCVPTDNQKAYMALLCKHGWYVEVVWDAEHAWKTLEKYISL